MPCGHKIGDATVSQQGVLAEVVELAPVQTCYICWKSYPTPEGMVAVKTRYHPAYEEREITVQVPYTALEPLDWRPPQPGAAA